MRLLIYSHYFTPSVGGVESIVLALASGLAAQRGGDGKAAFEITLVTQTPANGSSDQYLPFRVIRMPTNSKLWKLVRQADAVHVAGPALAPILHAIFARKPVIVEHHGFQAICPTGQLVQQPENIPCPGHFMARKHSVCLRCSAQRTRLVSIRLWFLTFVRRFLCRRIAINITPTHWLATQLHLPHLKTVHHGLRPSPVLIPVPTLDAVPLIVSVGRLVTTKGIHLLIDAAEILQRKKRAFRLVIIGGGPERVHLEELVQQRHLSSKIQFLGVLSDSEISSVLRGACCLVTPSLGGEVFGMVILENMMRGLPILASNLGAFVEVLGDSGFTFTSGDAAELAKQISRLLDNPSLAEGLRSSARRRALESFTIDRMIEEHAQIYRDVLKFR